MVCLTFNGDVFTCGEKKFIGHGELESDLNLPKKLTNIGKSAIFHVAGSIPS